jgi:hypothetical protein
MALLAALSVRLRRGADAGCLLLGILADRRPAALAGPVPGGPARPGAVVGRPRDWTEIVAALP